MTEIRTLLNKAAVINYRIGQTLKIVMKLRYNESEDCL